MDYDTSLIMQQALSLYLDNGMFKKNLSQLQHFFDQRQESAKELCHKLPDKLSYQVSPKNLSIQLPSQVKLGPFRERGLSLLDTACRIDQEESAYLHLANDQSLAREINKVKRVFENLEKIKQ